GASYPGLEPRKLEGALDIAYVNAGMNTYYSLVLDGIKEEIERWGGDEVANVEVYSPTSVSNMVEEQIQFLETLLQDDELDVLFFSCHNDAEFVPYMEQFLEKGVSVYLFNMPGADVTSDAYVSLVSYDFYDAGYKMGEWLATNKADEDVKLLYLEGNQGTHNTIRTQGFMDAIEGCDNIEIVVSQNAEWTREGGQKVTENALQSNPEINTIYGPYDEMPLGALAALKDAGRDDVTVLGYDCTEPGYAQIVAGKMAASVNTDAKQMGNHLVDAAVAHDLEGKEVEKKILNELIVIDSTNTDLIGEDNYVYTKREQEITGER
ncbi:MAG: sugar ABC transporter substrate-binding protein, partial [Lachnospiraceae bacterium]|nr:sugar ABC transporter substrate-binding protein [Lachnospiraceae bacterium]